MTWNPIDNPIDYFTLSGQKSPGIANVAGAGSPRKWDERNGYGISGATLWFTGLGVAKFTVKIGLYTRQDWADWHAWKPNVKVVPAGRFPKAKDIWHPYLEDLEIKSVVVEDVGQPEELDTGGHVIPIKFKQYRERKFQLVKPEASESTSTDPVDQTIERLTAQFNELAAE